MKEKIYIIIPVYNEEMVIGGIIKSLKSRGFFNIIVVDDGSFDDSASIAGKEGIFVLSHCLNRGKGAAIRTGIEAVKCLGADIVVTMDGDGQHDSGEIEKLIYPILNENYDVVLGSREFKEMSSIKFACNKIGNLMTKFLYGLKVKDSQCGFRAYSKKAMAIIETYFDNYEYDSEVIREVRAHNLTFKEILVKTIYTEYSTNKKQKQNFTNGIKTFIKMALYN